MVINTLLKLNISRVNYENPKVFHKQSEAADNDIQNDIHIVSNIHLLHAGEGNMKILFPPRFLWGNESPDFPNSHAVNVLLY